MAGVRILKRIPTNIVLSFIFFVVPSYVLAALMIYKTTIIYSVRTAAQVVTHDFQSSGIDQIVRQLGSVLSTNPFLVIDETVICSAKTPIPVAVDARKVDTTICGRPSLFNPIRHWEKLSGFEDLYVSVHAETSHVLIWVLSFCISAISATALIVVLIANARRRERKYAESKAYTQISAQVAHDIRSPLTTLNMIMGNPNIDSNDSKKLIGLAVDRINSIADSLLVARRGQHSQFQLSDNSAKPEAEYTSIAEVLASHTLLETKCIQLGKRMNSNISLISKKVEIVVPPRDMARCLEILVENSIDSISGDGFISVNAELVNNEFILEVRDSGKGIPQDILSRLGKEQISYGKLQGNGLGLTFVNQTISAANGSLKLISAENRGTTVIIRVPGRLAMADKN